MGTKLGQVGALEFAAGAGVARGREKRLQCVRPRRTTMAPSERAVEVQSGVRDARKSLATMYVYVRRCYESAEVPDRVRPAQMVHQIPTRGESSTTFDVLAFAIQPAS